MGTIVSVVLAAGASTRFGAANKLLHPMEGEPMIRRVARLHAPAVVVFAHEEVRAALAGLDVRLVHNPEPGRGMGRSIALGVGAVDADAILLALGDMPFVRPDTLRRLAALDADLARPVYRGRPGHPVRFGRVHHAALRALDGDRGARALVAEHGFTPLAVDDPGVLRDVDAPDDLDAAPGS